MENTVSAIKEVTGSTVCKLAEMVQEDCLISTNSNSKANGKDSEASLRSADQSSADFSSLLITETDTARKCEDSFNKDPNLCGKIEEDISEGAIDNSALVRDACTYSDKNNMLDEASSKLKAVKSNSKGDKKTENKGTNGPSKEGVMHDSGTLDQLNKKIGQLDSSKEEPSFSFRKLEKLEAEKPEAVLPDLERALLSPHKKKLLVLDLNGLLADIISDFHNAHKTQNKISGKAIFKRPFCDEFLNFCFERFHVGVWSSRKRYNVDSIVDFLMRDSKHKLLFCWDQSKCTYTGFNTLENRYKPLVLKELKKLWNKEEYDLPWEKGDYLPSNTLLVDDSPYKALRNPKHTAIFPQPFRFDDEKDYSLGPEGDLRVYLKEFLCARMSNNM